MRAPALLAAVAALCALHTCCAQPYPPTLANCTMQQKLRDISPVPISVVWIEKAGDTMESIRAAFRLIRASGFTALKQLQFYSELSVTQAAYEAHVVEVMQAALDEGLLPWWYGDGGYECITQALLQQLGLPVDTPMRDILKDPRMVAYQTQVLRWRVGNQSFVPYTLGEPGMGNPVLPTAEIGAFASWLEAAYNGNITALQAAWQDPYRNITVDEFDNFTGAATLVATGSISHDYLRYRDSMRFQADQLNADFAAQLAAGAAHDPQEPQRTGSAMMLDNQAYAGWDNWGHGKLAEVYGSYYISLHLAWHFSPMQREVDRPLHLMARMCVDAARGSWPGEWESTGGPSQYSGGFSTHVDAGMINRMLLGHLAAGMRGSGLWTFNGRSRGQESMEYQLVTIQGEPSSRALAAGAVAAAADAYRFELWRADAQPVVGIVYSWENEAIFARLFLQQPPFECSFDPLVCKYFTAQRYNEPGYARMGLARALLNAHMPFTLLDESELRGGVLATLPSLKAIYVPHMLGMSLDILDVLQAFQTGGGRVVADMPFLLFNNRSTVVDQSTLPSARMFGAYVADFQSTETPAYNRSVGEFAVTVGQYADLVLTTGTVTQSFDTGEPAVIANTVGTGAGSGCFINFEASRLNSFPVGTGSAPYAGPLDDFLVAAVTAGAPPSAWTGWDLLRASDADDVTRSPLMAHRRRAVWNGTAADHYFVINDLPTPQNVSIVTSGWTVASAADAVTGQPLTVQGSSNTVTFTVPQRNARWIRTVQA